VDVCRRRPTIPARDNRGCSCEIDAEEASQHRSSSYGIRSGSQRDHHPPEATEERGDGGDDRATASAERSTWEATSWFEACVT